MESVGDVFEGVFKSYTLRKKISEADCSYCKSVQITLETEKNVDPLLKYLNKDVLLFIYQSDTAIDEITDRKDAIEFMKGIRKKSSNLFSPEINNYLEKIYEVESVLIGGNVSNEEKLYLRCKSWIWSAVACITEDGIDFFKNNYQNWEEVLIKCALFMMILDDVIDLEEDKVNNQPNSLLLGGNNVIDLLDVEWVQEMLEEHKIHIFDNHIFDISCWHSLVHNPSVISEIKYLFLLLKKHVTGKYVSHGTTGYSV